MDLPLRASGALSTKLIKYAGVSVVTVIVTQTTLFIAYVLVDLSATASNVIAVSVGAIPSYVLSRRWVWQRSGPGHLWREIAPFWAYSLLGLVVSTVVVRWASEQWDSALIANAANLSAFFVLWIAKFLFLDRLLFPPLHDEVLA